MRFNGAMIEATPDALMKAVIDRYFNSGDFTVSIWSLTPTPPSWKWPRAWCSAASSR